MLSIESNLKSVYVNRYSLRPRENSDSRALFELFKQPLCQQGMICDTFASPAHFQSWMDGAGPDKLDIVATCETGVIGYAGLFLGRGNRGRVGSLSLFVHDEFHSRGIGGLLMRGILAVADARTHLRRIELFVICDNHRAIDLYRRFGFEIEGRHDCFARRMHNFVDVYSMSRIAKSGGDC